MKFVFSGGGKPELSRSLDKFFIDIVSTGNILFIPIAKTTRTPQECYDWISAIFKNLGFEGKMTLLSDLRKITINELLKFDAIYIGGGNTFHLLKEIKSTGFDKLLKDYLKQDKIIYGISAGAMIFCKDIDYAREIGDVNTDLINDTSSLNILKNVYIWPHYNPGKDSSIKKIVKRDKIKVIALPEGSGIFMDGTLSYVNSGEAYVFLENKKKRYKKEEKIP